MPLLELERVSKHSNGWRVLDDVSLVLDAREMVTVFGDRRSGRSTLLRVAAGIETPDQGSVRFDGEDLHTHEGQVWTGISYCRCTFRPDWGPTVVDQLVSGQLTRRVPKPDALSRARQALERTGVAHCDELLVGELRSEERIRVAVARALTAMPRLLMLDEPTLGLDLVERAGLLKLLRSLADEGISVLATTGTGSDFSGSDRVLALAKGKLRGEVAPELAPVTDLSIHRRQTSGS